MRRFLFILPFLTANTGNAEVTYNIDTRFGVTYTSDSDQGSGRTQMRYSGRYTTTISHQSDSGVVFRFEFGIETGNFDQHGPAELGRVQRQISIGTE